MKVVVIERKFEIHTDVGTTSVLTENEAREIWAGLNEHFGAKPVAPPDWTKYPFRHPLEMQYGAALDCNTG